VERRPPIDPLFIRATLRLARRGLTDAEIVRELQTLTPRARKAAPSYHAVRRLAGPARSRRLPNPYAEEILVKLLTGRFPDLYRAEILAYLRSIEDGTAGK
jgi:hypothetical protein